MIDSGGRGVNDQMQIVNTKLPNENIQTYQPQMIDSRGVVNDQTQIVAKLPNGNIQTFQPQMIDSVVGGGKWPNTNCEHQTTKYPNLPTTNDRFWGGGINHQMQIWIPNYQMKISKPTNHKWPVLGGGVNYQMQIVNTKLPIVIPSTTNTISHVKLKKWSDNLHLVV